MKNKKYEENIYCERKNITEETEEEKLIN